MRHSLRRCSASAAHDESAVVSRAELEACAASDAVGVCDSRVPTAQAVVDASDRGRRRIHLLAISNVDLRGRVDERLSSAKSRIRTARRPWRTRKDALNGAGKPLPLLNTGLLPLSTAWLRSQAPVQRVSELFGCVW